MICESVNTDTTSEMRKFRLNTDELKQWNDDGYFVRHNVFTEAENEDLSQMAKDIALEKRPFNTTYMQHNASVRDGKAEATRFHGMLSIQQVSRYIPEFLVRTRDPRHTDPIVDILGQDILRHNNLYIW